MSDKNLSGNLIPSTTKSPKRPPIPSFHLPILSQESLLDHESEESVSSIASLPVDSDDSSSEDDVPLSLQERMLRNQERNSHFLQLLHEKYNDQLPPPSNKPATIRKRKTTASDTLDEEEPRGMLRLKSVALPSSDSLDQRLQTLLENYPHRHAQIRRLMALLHAPSTVPIFVTGPRGTGKTSIVRDVLYALEGNAATINCQTLEPASMERLVADALKQLLRRKRKLVNADVEQVPKDLMPQKSETRPAVDPPPTKTSSLTDDIQHRLQPQRAAKLTAPNPLTPIVLRKSIVDDPVEASSHSAVVAFGRSLRRLSRMAVLVLDHAERLPQNGLAELLLLPKVMRLSLRIVLISRYAILKGMRLDTLASPEKSSATLTTSVGGSTILFPAYQESAVIKNVLKAPRMLPLIVGTIQTKQPFRNTIVDGFLTVLIQLLSDSTNDINEFVRIGNSLWPFYIQPLHPKSISDTIQSLPATDSDESLDRNILGQLGRRFWKYIGKMASELTQLSLDTQHLDGTLVTIPKRPFRIDDMKLPFLRICLLLACFICQNNRAENDRKVFSVHGNGKRRKTRKGNEKEIGEVAFASMGGSLEQLKSLRPRPFLVERVFSIFVTLVRLNPESAPQLPGKKREEYIADALGTTRLYEDLRQLIDLDFIHPVAYSGDVRGEQINLNSAKFWCSLTAQEASFLAEKIAIPLDSYIV